MIAKRDLRPILDNDSITRGLGDSEARILIEWLVVRTEQASDRQLSGDALAEFVETLCTRAKSISRFVSLWQEPQSRGAACQLAAVERFPWPLPSAGVDPCELMLDILTFETPDEEIELV